MIGEFDLIKKLIPLLPINEATRIGAGDDCSVLELGIPDRQLIFKTDAVVENVHFTREASWERIGCKAISRCLSDMAAMAGNPISALITLGIPQDFLEEDVLKIYEGLIRRAKTFGVSISGGETVKVEKSVFLSVSMVGWIRKNRLCLRSHVQPGDALFVTGELGGSILGKHLDFVPRVKEAQWLAEHFDIHAMIDLSDGLSGDLRRLIEASGIGVHLLKESIPVSKEAKLLAKERGTHPLNHALNDGEDFELLFAIAPNKAVSVLDAWKETFPGLRLSCIGKAVKDPGVRILSRKNMFLSENANEGILGDNGYDHFK